MLMQIHENQKLIKKFLEGHGQKMSVGVWSRDFRFDCISRMNRWNKLIFLHACTSSGKLKVASMIFGWD